jgi:two-component system nitrogen regulation response regulator NtrX
VSHGNILVVDDERGILDQLAGILHDEGFSVVTVTTGEEALAAVSREIFDLVLLDVWLPASTASRRSGIRAAGHQLPVVLSQARTAGVAVRAVREGSTSWEPLALERVLVTVHNISPCPPRAALRAERGERPLSPGSRPRC